MATAAVPQDDSKQPKRKRIGPDQLEVLEEVFRTTQHPSLILRNRIASKLDLSLRSVQIWFQNRRAKAKKNGANDPYEKESSLLNSNVLAANIPDKLKIINLLTCDESPAKRAKLQFELEKEFEKERMKQDKDVQSRKFFGHASSLVPGVLQKARSGHTTKSEPTTIMATVSNYASQLRNNTYAAEPAHQNSQQYQQYQQYLAQIHQLEQLQLNPKCTPPEHEQIQLQLQHLRARVSYLSQLLEEEQAPMNEGVPQYHHQETPHPQRMPQQYCYEPMSPEIPFSPPSTHPTAHPQPIAVKQQVPSPSPQYHHNMDQRNFHAQQIPNQYQQFQQYHHTPMQNPHVNQHTALPQRHVQSSVQPIHKQMNRQPIDEQFPQFEDVQYPQETHQPEYGYAHQSYKVKEEGTFFPESVPVYNNSAPFHSEPYMVSGPPPYTAQTTNAHYFNE